MDPSYLRPRELEYELAIRGVSGLSTQRQKIVALKEILKKEALGIETNPTNSGFVYAPENELRVCAALVESIETTLDSVGVNSEALLFTEAENRILHLKARLKRIKVKSSGEADALRLLFMGCDGLIRRIASLGRSSIGDRISFNLSREASLSTEGNGTVQPDTGAATGTARSSSSLNIQSDFAGFGITDVIDDVRPVGNLGRGRGRVSQGGIPTARGNESLGAGHGRPVTPAIFSERLEIPTSQSLFNLNKVGVDGERVLLTSNNHRDSSDVTSWQDELRHLVGRENGAVGGERRTGSDVRTLGSDTETMRLNASVPTHTRVTNDRENLALPTQNHQRIRNQYVRVRDASPVIVRHSTDKQVPAANTAESTEHCNRQSTTEQYRDNYNRYEREERESRDEFRYHRDNGPPSSAFVNNVFPATQFVRRNNIDSQCPRSNLETYVQSEKNTQFGSTTANQHTNAKSTAYLESPRRFSDPCNYADSEEEETPAPAFNLRSFAVPQPRDEFSYNQRGRTAPQARDEFSYNQRATAPLPRNEFAYNQRATAPLPRDEFVYNQGATAPLPRNDIRNRRYDIPPPPPPLFNHNYAPGHGQLYEPQIDVRAQPPRAAHKAVSVNRWKISFSGDGQGLHLFDFLSQVRMLQRAEMIPDWELLPSMVHLFTGRAKNWYGSWAGTFATWDELVEALRTEFLPENYRFIMLEKITSRKQKPGESIGEFLALMQSLFTWLDIPIDNLHQVFIVRNNLLPKYSQGVAPFEIRSLSELAKVCRRVESATQSVTMSLPFESHNYSRNQFQRSRTLNELEQEEEPVDCVGDLCAIGRSGPIKCFNCQKNGHIFRSCTKPRDGVFCYGCGIRNVTTKNCDKCAGNGARGMADRASQEVSPVAQAAVQSDALPRHSSA